MRKNYRKFSTALIFSLLFVMFSSNVFAQDYNSHWAKSAIDRWYDKGVVKGYLDGTFKPNNPVTRAEFASVLQRLFNLTMTSNTKNYSDVLADKWYTDSINIVMSRDVMNVYDETFKPSKVITREEASFALANLFILTNKQNQSFADDKQISGWALDQVYALAEAKGIQGRLNNNFDPQGKLTRAELLTIIDNLTSELFSKPGTYKGVADQELKRVIINSAEVTLTDYKIAGDLYLTESVGHDILNFNNIKVAGSIHMLGNGTQKGVNFKDSVVSNLEVGRASAKLNIESSQITNLNITGDNVQVTIDKNTDLKSITIKQGITASINGVIVDDKTTLEQLLKIINNVASPSTPSTGSNQGSISGGSTGGSTDPSTGGSTGGSTNPSTGGSTNPSTGGSTNPSTGGSTDPSTGGSTDPSTGGSTNPSTGGSTNPSTGGSTDPSTGGSGGAGTTTPPTTNPGTLLSPKEAADKVNTASTEAEVLNIINNAVLHPAFGSLNSAQQQEVVKIIFDSKGSFGTTGYTEWRLKDIYQLAYGKQEKDALQAVTFANSEQDLVTALKNVPGLNLSGYNAMTPTERQDLHKQLPGKTYTTVDDLQKVINAARESILAPIIAQVNGATDDSALNGILEANKSALQLDTISYDKLSAADKTKVASALLKNLPAGGYTAESLQKAFVKEVNLLTGHVAPVFAEESIQFVNDKRATLGLPAYVHDPDLSRIAQIKAQDMIDNNYLEHTSPVYGGPDSMLTHFGYYWSRVGENLHMGSSTARGAVDAWIASPGHYANIKNTEFRKIGAGYAVDAYGRAYWVHMFATQ